MSKNQSMSESQKELMSKLMDGEISNFELHRLLKDSESSDELREYWSELNLVQTANDFGEVEPIAGTSFADSIQAKIAADTEVESDVVVEPKSGWWKTVGQLALVASVATLMVAVAPLVNVSPSGDVENIAEFQVDDETVYDLNALLALQTPQNELVSTQGGVTAGSLNQDDRKLMAALEQGAYVVEPKSAEEQERIARLMSEYMILHANGAGLNSTSSVQNYLQVAPKQ